MKAPIEIRLEQPIDYLSIRYEMLPMRSPNPSDISFVKRKYHTKYLRGLHLTARMCGVPVGVLRNICSEDAERIGVEVNYYLDEM